jgi:DNA mismatch endonuclease (patch repair protein)
MALVRHKDTKPELRVRRFFHAAGLRYRLHSKALPGRPDLIFPARRVAVFIHGCFWHRHPAPDCKLSRLPKSRLEFWQPKLDGNTARDTRNTLALEAAGWRVLIIWECETRDLVKLAAIADEIAHLDIFPHRGNDLPIA